MQTHTHTSKHARMRTHTTKKNEANNKETYYTSGFTKDLDWKTKYPNILLDKGNDNKLDPKAEELVTFGNWIHEQKLDYKLPIGSER